MIRAIDPVDNLRNVVRQQFVDPAVKIRIIFSPALFEFQGQVGVTPEKVVAAGFVDESNDAAANARSNVSLEMDRFEPHNWDAIDVEVLTNGGHDTWLPEPEVNANQDRGQHYPPQPQACVPARRLAGVEHRTIPKAVSGFPARHQERR